MKPPPRSPNNLQPSLGTPLQCQDVSSVSQFGSPVTGLDDPTRAEFHWPMGFVASERWCRFARLVLLNRLHSSPEPRSAAHQASQTAAPGLGLRGGTEMSWNATSPSARRVSGASAPTPLFSRGRWGWSSAPSRPAHHCRRSDGIREPARKLHPHPARALHRRQQALSVVMLASKTQ